MNNNESWSVDKRPKNYFVLVLLVALIVFPIFSMTDNWEKFDSMSLLFFAIFYSIAFKFLYDAIRGINSGGFTKFEFNDDGILETNFTYEIKQQTNFCKLKEIDEILIIDDDKEIGLMLADKDSLIFCTSVSKDFNIEGLIMKIQQINPNVKIERK